jgi:hypothetical protein
VAAKGCRPTGSPSPPVLFIRSGRSDPGTRCGTPTPRDRRLAVVVFRRPGGRRGRVQLDNPGDRPESASPVSRRPRDRHQPTVGIPMRSSTVGRYPHADPGARRAPGVEISGGSARRKAPERSWRQRVAALRARPHPRSCSSGRAGATPELVAEHRHPGIDDLQSSSSAGPAGGGVECNSTIPGTALKALHPSVAARVTDINRRSASPCHHQPSVGIPMPTRVPAGHPGLRSLVTPGLGRRPSIVAAKGCRPRRLSG